ncbi:hypothetical protein DFQ26_001901 [Actinomortierella ambigua]|nr:hypothetical protein DFQ26_001901 [Actinomortierella ambigua]
MGALIKIVTHVDGRRLERVFEFDPLSTCRSAVEKLAANKDSCVFIVSRFSRKHRGWIHDKTKMEDIVFKGHILLSPNGLLPTLQMATIEEVDYYNFDSDSGDFAWMVKTALGWGVDADSSSSSSSASLASDSPVKKRTSSLRRALSRSPSRSRTSPKFSRSIHDQHTSLAAALSAAPSAIPPALLPNSFPDRTKDYKHENALRQAFVATMQQAQDKLGLVEPLTMVYDKMYELQQVDIKTVVVMQHIPETYKDQVAAALIQLGSFRWRHADSFSHSFYSGKEEFWTDFSSTYENYKAPVLSSGLYVGLFHTESHLSGLRILVPKHRRNMIPLAKIRDDAELSDSEWEWIQSTSTEPDADMLARRCSVPKDDPMHHLKVEFARAAAKLAKQTKVQWMPGDLYTDDTLRLYTAQTITTPPLSAAVTITEQQQQEKSCSISFSDPPSATNGGRTPRSDADFTNTVGTGDGTRETMATGRTTGGVDRRQNRFIALNTDTLWRDPMFHMNESQLRLARSTEVRIILYVKPTRLATDRRAVFNEQYLEYHPYQIFDATHHLVYNPVVYQSLRKAMRQLTKHALAVEARLASSVLARQEEESTESTAITAPTATMTTASATASTTTLVATTTPPSQKLAHNHSLGTLSESALADLDVKGDFGHMSGQPRRPSMITMASKRVFSNRLSVFSLEQEDEEDEEEEERSSIITSTTNTEVSSTISSHHQFSGVSDHGDDEFEARSPRDWQDMMMTSFRPSTSSTSSSTSSPWRRLQNRRPTGALILDAVQPLRHHTTSSSSSSSSPSITSACSSPNGQPQHHQRIQNKALPQLPALSAKALHAHQGLFPAGPQSSYLSLKPASPLLPPEHPFGEGSSHAGNASKSNINNTGGDGGGSGTGDRMAASRRRISFGANNGGIDSKATRRRSSAHDHPLSSSKVAGLKAAACARGRRQEQQSIFDFLRTVEKECREMTENFQTTEFMGLTTAVATATAAVDMLNGPAQPHQSLQEKQESQQEDDIGFEKLILQYAGLVGSGENGGTTNSGGPVLAR